MDTTLKIELDEGLSEFLNIWGRVTGKPREEIVLAILKAERHRLAGLFGELERMKEIMRKEEEMHAQIIEKL